MRILLIEDDEVLLEVLLQSLKSQRYLVDKVVDGQMGWEYAQSSCYDLILMDVGLPKLDGITLCKRLRSEGYKTPILLMTAKDAGTDRIRGLDAGADDYLIKPLDLSELQARVRALLRRGEVSPTTVLQVGDLLLDPRSCQVSYKEKPLKLTPKEYNLLEIFLRNPSRVYSRGQLLEYIWSFDEEPPLEESVKAHIKGLRQKLKAAGAVDWIENVYGVGYRLKEGVGERSSKKLEQVGQQEEEAEKEIMPTASTVEQQFNQRMAHLWLHYRELMAQRLSAVQAAATALQTGTFSPELRQGARQAAHKLAGVLGMFEQDAGTEIAREIEQILQGDEQLQPVVENRLFNLVEKLNEILELAQPEMSTCSEMDISRLLLIDSDLNLLQDLQLLAQERDMSWKQVSTVELAKTWLESHSPDLVVLAVDEVRQPKESMGLLANLASRTPPVPTLVLVSEDGLLDRVTVARTGGQGFLVKPVTGDRVWNMVTQLLERTHSLTVKVLVVDDDPVFLAALRPLLEPWGIRMTGLDDPLRFWEVLGSTDPNLLILDVDMPQLSGIELCHAVRIDPDWQRLPILFLTNRCDRETIQQIFAAGADDYLTKPVIGAELLTRITNRLERTQLLEKLSHKETLTGLTNQLKSSKDLENLLKNASSSLCLAVFTLNDLHQINIQYGHSIGNQVLQRWGRLFQSAFRGTEVSGYWGCGEFVVGLPGLTKLEASDRLCEVLSTLRQQVFTAPDNSRFQVSFSCSIAEYPTDGLTLQALYQFATKNFQTGATP